MASEERALEIIEEALKKVLKEETVSFNTDTDLIEEEILDSLDSMVFAMEVEKLSGRTFPEDADLVDLGYFKIDKLVRFLGD